MVGSPLAAFTNSAERLIARKSYVDYCTILEVDKDGTDGVKCHSPDHPEYYNTVSLKIRSTKLVHEESQDPNAIQHVNALILQTFVGNCFGEPYIPRVGDLVAVLFMYNEKPLVLGPVATIQQPPVMRAPTSEDAKYDYVNKWCQWLRPEKDKNYDYFNHPQGKKPICFKRFHGPVTGEVGIGRDEMTVWDCQKGDADPTCTACSNIDSVPRSGEQWNKIYSTQTESEEAYNSRMELHARCGSYFRIESDNTNESGGSSSEYSENIGHIRLGNALTETDKRFHFNVQGNRYGNNGVGSFDLHTNHEEVQIASESTGVRFAGIRTEDSQVNWAYEFMNFPTTSFIRCYKNGIIEINSLDGDSSITVDGTSNKVTVDGTINVELKASSEVTCTTPLTHVTGDMQIDGACTHGSCSCTGTFAVSAGASGGQTLCGGTGVDEELTLCGTSDASKGCVNVDSDLKCSGNCQLPSIFGSDLEDGELTLSGTSDVSKGRVTVDADLECTGALGDNLKTLIEACYTKQTGWLSAGENWTFASADSPTFTFTISGDKSAKYSPGMRIRIDQSGIKYFIITSVSYSSPDTSITVYGGTDYTMTSATIKSPCYSMLKAPVRFPLDPTKWTVTVTDSTQRSKTTDISDSTWYNIDAAARISVPIGIWNVSYMVYGSSSVTATPAWHSVRVCLSSSSNSCSDNLSLHEHLVLTDLHNNILSVATIKVVTTAKTTYYVNIQCSADTAITLLRYYNDLYPMVIKAECAYL